MDDLENSVASVLISDDAKGLVATYAEIGVDALLEDGVARDIPVISSIVAVTRMGANVRDRLFAKKLLAFLSRYPRLIPGNARNSSRSLKTTRSMAVGWLSTSSKFWIGLSWRRNRKWWPLYSWPI